jgi:type III secretion protein J
VFIRHVPSVAMNDLMPQVKMLVANGVAGLSYDKVSVINVAVPTPEKDLAASTEPEIQSFLGLWMHRDSIAQAERMLLVLLALVAALAGLAAYVFWSRRQQVYSLTAERRGETP